MKDGADYRKESEAMIEQLKAMRVPVVEKLTVIDIAITAHMRVVELTEKLRDD